MLIVAIDQILGSPQLTNNYFSESPTGGMYGCMTNRDKEAPMDQAKLIKEEPYHAQYVQRTTTTLLQLLPMGRDLGSHDNK